MYAIVKNITVKYETFTLFGLKSDAESNQYVSGRHIDVYIKRVNSAEDEEIIPFTTKEEIGTKEEVKQKGIDGKKVITTEIITDESGNVLSSTIIEEKTTIEPVEQIVVKVKEEEEKSKESTNENSSSSGL